VGPCNPVGQTGNFVCTSAGTYPDPYDCQKYHLCYQNGDNLVAVNIECEQKTAFSPMTGTCSQTLKDPVCTDKTFVCNNVGDKAAWPGNANIFYICMATQIEGKRSLFPTLYRCPENYSFNGEDCVPGNSPGLPGPGGPQKACNIPGLMPDMTNCRSYWYCNNKFQVQQIQCRTGTYFDKVSLSCKVGDC
jgi:Chitin binding Peritrophin-A domain